MPFAKFCQSFTPFVFLAVSALGQVDHFNDGNDDGWTRQDTLSAALGSPFASFSIEDGAYRIQVPESPAPGALGPARSASFRQDVVYTDRIFISVDLKVSDPAIQQAIGVLAFVQSNPGLGVTSGYSLSYQPDSRDLVLNSIVNEVPERLGAADVTGLAGDCVRLVFIAENGLITGALFSIDDLVNPIALLATTDTTFTSGTAGVFVFSDTDDATGSVDAAFDNYRANAISIPELVLASKEEGPFQLSWPEWAVHFAPSTRSDLRALPWQEIARSRFLRNQGQFTLVVDPEEVTSAFFRLERRPF